MSNCPSCGAGIEDDFGLVTCSSCGTTLFVEMDGKVQLSQNTNTSPNYSNESLEIISDAEHFEELGAHTQIENTGEGIDIVEHQNPMGFEVENFNSVEISDTTEPIQMDSDYNLDLMENNDSLESTETIQTSDSSNVTDPQTPIEELDSTEPIANLESFEESENLELDHSLPPPLPLQSQESDNGNLDQGDIFLDEKEEVPSHVSTENVMEDVIAFANSEKSQASQGIYLYTLRLDGIDSGDIKSFIQETLSNSRLKLNVQELMTSIKKGHLTIRNLNPVKAYIIVNELKGLPIEIYWEQNDITS